MRLRAGLLLILPALVPGLAMAQRAGVAPVQSNSQIVVEGRKAEKAEPMSGWRIAETSHVLVYSNGDKDQLVRTAHNLEKLHFLLSVLLNRVGEPDDVAKLKVVLIGDRADFDHLELRNLRWQQGPYPPSFPDERYYDPRADGAMLATTTTDQRVTLQRGRDLRTVDLTAVGGPKELGPGLDPSQLQAGEIAFAMTAEGRLYSGYAQHYLLSYFPAAYPRWYLDGFGEIFSTLVADTDGAIEYGRAPDGFRNVVEWYERYPVQKLFDGSYLTSTKRWPRWTPFHAWALAHMLFFSDEWHEPLHRYLAAMAGGAPPEEAAAELGDPDKLQAALNRYRGRKIPFERMTYPPARAGAPIVRQLSRREALSIQSELIIESRLAVPPLPPAGADAETIARMNRDRSNAIATRDRWIADLRRNAGQYPHDIESQLLLAEAECRSENNDACLDASHKALALAPRDPNALTWAGIAQTRRAIQGPAGVREAWLRDARALLVRANHVDPEATLPLLAYYRSYADAGETAPDVAIDGLIKVTEAEPAAPGPRLLLGEELARRGAAEAAARTLRPIANGPYDSPEKPKAQALLASLAGK